MTYKKRTEVLKVKRNDTELQYIERERERDLNGNQAVGFYIHSTMKCIQIH